MAFFAYAGGRGSTTAMIVANRGQRKEKSFYRTSRISGFSVARSTSTTVLPSLQPLKITQVANSSRRQTVSKSEDTLFNSESNIIDLLENKVETTKKVSLSPEALERLAWFSSYSSDEEISVCDVDEEEDCISDRAVRVSVDSDIVVSTETKAPPELSPRVEEVESIEEVNEDLKYDVQEDSCTRESDPSMIEIDSGKNLRYPQITAIAQETNGVFRTRFNSREDWVEEEEEDDLTDDEEEEEYQSTYRVNHELCDIHRNGHVQHVSNQKSQISEIQSKESGKTPETEQPVEVVDKNMSEEPEYAMIGHDLCEQLTNDIEQMVEWVDIQHEKSAFVRHENVRLLKACIQSVLGEGVNLIEYGSSGVGLALPDSDLDYVIVLEKRSNAFNLARPQQLESLTKVLEVLKEETWVNNISFVSTAGIPVIKFHGVGGRPIDLSCLGALHQGLRTQHFIEDELNAKPHLRSIVVVLKQLVRDNGLGDTSSGGVSSYGLFIIVGCFLSWHMQMTHDFGNSSFSVGWMLLAFLEQHATLLDYTALVFTVNGYEARSHLWSHFAHDMIAVSDPFDDQRNVGRALYRLSHFHTVLRNMWNSLSHGGRLESVINTRPVSVLSNTVQPHTSWIQAEAAKPEQ